MTDSRGPESLSLTLVGMAVKTDKLGMIALATDQTLFIRLHNKDIAHMRVVHQKIPF